MLLTTSGEGCPLIFLVFNNIYATLVISWLITSVTPSVSNGNLLALVVYPVRPVGLSQRVVHIALTFTQRVGQISAEQIYE